MKDLDLLPVLGNWARGKGPLYQRLAASLRDAIRRGDLTAPTRLPSERNLARSLHVSRTTVISAYRVLREERLLESARGSGTRVAASPAWLGIPGVRSGSLSLKFLADPPEGVIDCSGSVVPDFAGVWSDVLDVKESELRALARAFGYEPTGLLPLRAALAERYERVGMATSPEEIIVTTGAQQAIQLLFNLFGQDQATILVEEPTYVGAIDAARASGARVLGVAMDRHGIDPIALRDALRGSRPSLAYLMPSCHNPTGAVMTPARRREVVSIAADAGVPLVDDMTLADLVFDGDPQLALGTSGEGNIITIGSLSKIVSPGLRVGWLRAPRPLIGRLARLKLVADLGSAHLTQLLGLRVLAHLDDVRVARTQQLLERARSLAQLLQETLPTWSFSMPRGGPFLWVALPSGDAESFANVALRYGVRVLPGARMSSSRAFADHLRISSVADPDDLETAVERLCQAWTSYSSRADDPVSVEVVV
jgi:DNA-binding transcriptional MocR family regulator